MCAPRAGDEREDKKKKKNAGGVYFILYLQAGTQIHACRLM
jgi:hypothetical protein